ncbi:MAG: HD domain-containing protein [Candidatus Methanomethylicia archaeon]
MCNLFEALERIGRIRRTGWIMAKIPNDIAESIAEHTLKTILITMMICKEAKCNEEKSVKMALTHDLPEALISDIPKPIKEKINSKDIQQISLSAFKEIINDEELIQIYMEYLEGESLEARIVDLADNIATYIQSINYRKQYGIMTEHLKRIEEHTRVSVYEKAKGLSLNIDEIMKKLIGK